MNLHTPKWTPTLGVIVPMNSWIFKKQLQGSKPIGLRRSLYHSKLLDLRCVKWARMTHLDTSNASYDQKEGRESKVKNCPNSLACRWSTTYFWKALDEGYNFALELISIRGLHTKLWAPKFIRDPTLGISKLPSGSPETKWHLSASPVAKHKVYYKGEGGGFPQVRAVVSFVSPSLFVVRPSTKSAPTMH
jgi:hypothetical protein